MNDTQPQMAEMNAPNMLAPKSHGEKRFDRWVYGIMNGVGTFIVTLPLAYWATYGKGAKAFEKLGGALEEFGLSSTKVQNIIRTTALGLGGTIMVPFVRLAESFRRPLVQWLSNGKEDRTDAQIHMKEIPPQTWGSLLLGRLTAWVAVFVSFETISILNKEGLAKFQSAFAEKLINNPLSKTAFKSLDEVKLYRYSKLAALDVFATAAATILLYTGSRFFARRTAGKTHDGVARIPAAPLGMPLADAAQTQSDGTTPTVPETLISGDKAREGLIGQPTLSHSLQ